MKFESKLSQFSFWLSFCFVLAVGLSAALHPEVRSSLRKWFNPNFREVLSIVEGDILNDGKRMKVIKVKGKKGLRLEVYGDFQNGTRPLFDMIQMTDRNDAYFHYTRRARVTNLILDDVDGDRILEIIAPSYDSSLRPHLNVFRYNASNQRFEPMAPN